MGYKRGYVWFVVPKNRVDPNQSNTINIMKSRCGLSTTTHHTRSTHAVEVIEKAEKVPKERREREKELERQNKVEFLGDFMPHIYRFDNESPDAIESYTEKL